VCGQPCLSRRVVVRPIDTATFHLLPPLVSVLCLDSDVEFSERSILNDAKKDDESEALVGPFIPPLSGANYPIKVLTPRHLSERVLSMLSPFSFFCLFFEVRRDDKTCVSRRSYEAGLNHLCCDYLHSRLTCLNQFCLLFVVACVCLVSRAYTDHEPPWRMV